MFQLPDFTPRNPATPLGVGNPGEPPAGTLKNLQANQNGFLQFSNKTDICGQQYMRTVHAIPCNVVQRDATPQKTFIPKGTLIAFSVTNPVVQRQGLDQFRSKNTRASVPVANVRFNGYEDIPTDDTVVLFVLPEAVPIYPNKTQHLACAVFGNVDVAIPAGNPAFDVRPGDRIYARLENGRFHLIPGGQHVPHDIYLGMALMPTTYNAAYNVHTGQTITLLLDPHAA